MIHNYFIQNSAKPESGVLTKGIRMCFNDSSVRELFRHGSTGYHQMALNWHVVATKTNEEDTAVSSLFDQGFNVFAPIIYSPREGKAPRREFLFQGYVFVQFDPTIQSAGSINNSYGVRHLVSFGGILGTLRDEVIDAIQNRLQTPKTVTLEPKTCPKPGESVKIESGPFRDLNAIFVEPNGAKRSSIILSLLGADRKLIVNNSDIGL